jgi:hypothetical protein
MNTTKIQSKTSWMATLIAISMAVAAFGMVTGTAHAALTANGLSTSNGMLTINGLHTSNGMLTINGLTGANLWIAAGIDPSKSLSDAISGK